MRKPYTLVEILVAVSIIGILTATGLGITSYVRNKVAETQTKTTIKLIEMAFQKYNDKTGSYPVTEDKNGSDLTPFLAIEIPKDWTVNDLKWITAFNDVTLPQSTSTNPTASGLKIRGIRLEETNGSANHRKYYFLDGWGRKLICLNPGIFNSSTSYDLISFGGDKLAGDGSTTKGISDCATEKQDKFKEQTFYPDEIGDDITNFTRN